MNEKEKKLCSTNLFAHIDNKHSLEAMVGPAVELGPAEYAVFHYPAQIQCPEGCYTHASRCSLPNDIEGKTDMFIRLWPTTLTKARVGYTN